MKTTFRIGDTITIRENGVEWAYTIKAFVGDSIFFHETDDALCVRGNRAFWLFNQDTPDFDVADDNELRTLLFGGGCHR